MPRIILRQGLRNVSLPWSIQLIQEILICVATSAQRSEDWTIFETTLSEGLYSCQPGEKLVKLDRGGQEFLLRGMLGVSPLVDASSQEEALC